MAKSEAECLAIVKEQIADWRTMKYTYAANLLQYFIDKKGPRDYLPTTADIQEVRQHGRQKIASLIDAYVNEVKSPGSYKEGMPTIYRYGPGKINVKIFHPGKGSTASSNIRWWYVGSDKNMFYAFGGADLNVNGVATLSVSGRKRIWSGSFNVSVGDRYAFESKSKLKTMISAISSNAYDAALKLERTYGYKPFYHKATLQLRYNDVTTRISGP